MNAPRYGKWRFTRYRVANPTWTLPKINRIMGWPIGVYIVLGKYSYGVSKPITAEDRRRREAKKLP